jgi:hypothetical protein
MKLVETHRLRQEIRGYGAPRVRGRDSLLAKDGLNLVEPVGWLEDLARP